MKLTNLAPKILAYKEKATQARELTSLALVTSVVLFLSLIPRLLSVITIRTQTGAAPDGALPSDCVAYKIRLRNTHVGYILLFYSRSIFFFMTVFFFFFNTNAVTWYTVTLIFHPRERKKNLKIDYSNRLDLYFALNDFASYFNVQHCTHSCFFLFFSRTKKTHQKTKTRINKQKQTNQLSVRCIRAE